MKRLSILKYFFFLLALPGSKLFSQSPLIVNVQVLPPFSPFIADYISFSGSSVITIINTSNTGYDVKLAVNIEGDNGIEAHTNPGFMPSLPITIAPFATRIIYGSELQSYNDVGYTIVGTDANQLALTGMIPDGFYTLCVQALDYYTEAPLSGAEPSGCIPLNIHYLDAPYLLSPICGDSIDERFPQNIIFNWVAPPGAPLGTLYQFKMAEVLPADRNPYDAMASATTPAFFEATTTIPLLVYGPAQPPLETGHTYAWQVTASYPPANLFFQNDGKSEVCSFIYRDNFVNYIGETSIPINVTPAEPVDSNYVAINGNMQYYYDSENTDGGTINTSNAQTSATLYPFANEPVRLVLKYMLKYNGGNDSIYLPWNATGVELPDNDAVIDYGTTSATGDFSLLILRSAFPDLGLVQQGVTVTIPDADLIGHYYDDDNGTINFPSGGFGSEPENGYTFSTAQDHDYTTGGYTYGTGFSTAGNQFANYTSTGTTFKNTVNPPMGTSGSNALINKPASTNGSTSVLNTNGSSTVLYSNDLSGTYSGDLYRVVQVYHNNPYFCMPDESFQPLDTGSVYVGVIKERVRDYVLHVDLNDIGSDGTVNYINNNSGTSIDVGLDGNLTSNSFSWQPDYMYMDDADNDGQFTLPLEWHNESGMYGAENPLYRYSIYRELRPEDAPVTEGMNLSPDETNTSGFQTTDNGIVAQGSGVSLYNKNASDPVNINGINPTKTATSTSVTSIATHDYSEGRTLVSRIESSTGNVTFNKLVKSLDEDDYYILVIEPVDNSIINPAVEIRFLYDYNDFNKKDKALYNNQYTTPEVNLDQTDNTILSGTAVIEGDIKYKYDDPEISESFPLKNVPITLQRVKYVIDENGNKFYDPNRIDLATTTTDASGNYLFNYTDTAQYGLIAEEGSVTYGWGCGNLPEYQPNNDLIPNIDINNHGPHAETTREKLLAGKPDDGPCVASGRLYQELAIKVQSNYYTSPSTHFTILPAQHKEVSTLYCYVKAYDLNVTVVADPSVEEQYKAPGDVLRGMQIILLRANRPPDVPENEVIVNQPVDGSQVAKFISNAEKLTAYSDYELHVDPLAIEGLGYAMTDMSMQFFDQSEMNINADDIIATAYSSSFTGVGQQIEFKNLVKNVGSTDGYMLIAIPDYENSDINYIVPLHTFKTDFILSNSSHPYGTLDIQGSEPVNPEGIYPKFSVHYTMEAEPLPAVIFGKVLRSDNGFPLVDAKVQLLKSTTYPADANIVEVETSTAADGSYVLMPTLEQYNGNSVAQFSRALLFSKYGYDDTKTSSNIFLKKGKIMNRVADTLQPGVLVEGYVWRDAWDDATETYPSAPSTVQIGNGPMVHTTCLKRGLPLDAGTLSGLIEQTNPFDPSIFMEEIYSDIYDPAEYDPNDFSFQADVVLGMDNTLNTQPGKFDAGELAGGTTNYSLDLDAGDADGGIFLNSGGNTFEADGGTCELAYYATFASRGTWFAQIHPDVTEYIPGDQYVYIPDTGYVLHLDFMVYENQHRLRFTVKDENGAPVNANIEVVGVTNVLSTGTDGKRDVSFKNSATDFKILISGPANSNYVQQELDIENEASASYSSYTITLEHGVNISGRVTTGGSGVENARVYVDAAGMEYNEAFTNSSGNYTLYGVPKNNNFIIRAVKEASGLVGDYTVISTNIAGYTISNINFELDAYTALDLSKLLGFDTEIESVTTSGGVTKITGALVNISSNDNFSVASSVELPFSLVAVKAGTAVNASGIPFAEPVGTSFNITNSEAIPLTVFGNYIAQAGLTSGGCYVEKINTTSGRIKSAVKILETSFTAPSFSIEGIDDNGIYLNNIGMTMGGTGQDKIVLFTSGTEPKPNNDYYEIGMPAYSSSLLFDLYGVNAYITSSTTNRIYADSLVLDTWLNPQIDHTDGFVSSLHVGRMHITPDFISSQTGTSPISIKMEQWNLSCSDWSYNTLGFTMKSGTLDASGVEFNFNDIKINEGDLVFETSNALGTSSVRLIDLLDLDINNSPDFIYNGFHWQVYVGGTLEDPAATINNLPGLPSYANDLTLQLLLFESNADAEFKMNNNAFELYKVTTFTTDESALYVHSEEGDKYITLPGIIDLHLPQISVQPTDFIIRNNHGSVQTELEAFGFGMEVNGITANFNAGDIQFFNDGLIVDGTVSEDPYFSHDVKLYHFEDSTAINTVPNQQFKYTNTAQSLQNIFGRMYPLTSSWTNYQFTGDVTGANQTSGRWTFTVYGDITAENQKADVSNLKMEGDSPMDFDNMGMSYDFAHKRLVGSISIDESMPGGGGIKGQADCVFDDDGWYFVCGGQVTMPSNPYLDDVSLALLFGDYPIQDEQAIKDVFVDYSYDGELPKAFSEEIAGFYFDGKIEMPIPYVPNFEVNFGIVNGEFDAGITAGFQLGMNFTETTNTYYSGMEVAVHVHAGVGASVVIGCAGVSLDASVALELRGEYQSNGNWFIQGTFPASIGASAYAGAGLACDSHCDGLCEYDTWTGTASVELKGEFGSTNGEDYSDVGIESVEVH